MVKLAALFLSGSSHNAATANSEDLAIFLTVGRGWKSRLKTRRSGPQNAEEVSCGTWAFRVKSNRPSHHSIRLQPDCSRHVSCYFYGRCISSLDCGDVAEISLHVNALVGLVVFFWEGKPTLVISLWRKTPPPTPFHFTFMTLIRCNQLHLPLPPLVTQMRVSSSAAQWCCTNPGPGEFWCWSPAGGGLTEVLRCPSCLLHPRPHTLLLIGWINLEGNSTRSRIPPKLTIGIVFYIRP